MDGNVDIKKNNSPIDFSIYQLEHTGFVKIILKYYYYKPERTWARRDFGNLI